MSDQAANGLIAIGLGSLLAVLLLIPVAAVRYRRTGALGPRDLVLLLGVAVYGLALWTYTLLPLPSGELFPCRPAELDPLASFRMVGAETSGSLLARLRDPAFAQIALNVLLFVPLGYYVRRVLRRGVIVAALLGLSISALIEATQLTGVWSIYDCAYRLFDTSDLLVNTAGAMVGSLVSIVLVRHDTAGSRVLPQSITMGRRLMGVVCDLLFIVIVGAVVGLGWRAFQVYADGVLIGGGDVRTQSVLQLAVPLALEAASVLLAGRTVGEWAVSIRAVARVRTLAPLSRLVKLATGIGPLFVVPLLPSGYALSGLTAYLLVSLVVAWRSTGHRGVSHAIAGMDLEVAR